MYYKGKRLAQDKNPSFPVISPVLLHALIAAGSSSAAPFAIAGKPAPLYGGFHVREKKTTVDYFPFMWYNHFIKLNDWGCHICV